MLSAGAGASFGARATVEAAIHKHGALMLAGRGFGRPFRALICSYNGDTPVAFWRSIQVRRAIQLAMSLAKPVQDKSAVLFGGISMRK